MGIFEGLKMSWFLIIETSMAWLASWELFTFSGNPLQSLKMAILSLINCRVKIANFQKAL
jgi:hypothetical protein